MSRPATPFRIGYVPLSDAAPVIVAAERGVYRQRGLDVTLVSLPSWPAVRDALLSGEVDAAHCLVSLPLSVALGLTGDSTRRLAVVMVLNSGGQAISLGRGVVSAGGAGPPGPLESLAEAARSRRLTLAMTYPGGTHDIWLRYWLDAGGIDARGIDIIPIPPPQMVANLAGGTMDGFSAGEPWPAMAAERGIAVTAVRSGDVVAGHPEKALVVRPDTVARRGTEVRALIGGTLAACRLLESQEQRRQAAAILAAPRHLNVSASIVTAHLVDDVDFHAGGRVNVPRRNWMLWFLAQMDRLGLVPGAARARGLAEDLVLDEPYRDAARAEGVDVPADDMAPIMVPLDGVIFDPRDPAAEVGRGSVVMGRAG